jgi:DNA-directed RNA polymerase specialized sigma subunit
MTAFDEILSQVFDHGAEERLELGAEREAIYAAQASDEGSTLALIYAYAPVLRSLASRHAARLGVEEARSVAVSGLLEAIHAFDLDAYEGRLAGIASDYVSNALRETDAEGGLTVPFRTRRRFLAILRRAGGDMALAQEIAEENGMTRETFIAVREATSVSSIDGEDTSGEGLESRGALSSSDATPIWTPDYDAFTSADDRILSEAALDAVDGIRKEVCLFAYGYETGEALSDGEVAQALSERELGEEAVAAGQYVASRAKVQRERVRALGEMRHALGVA